MYVCIRNWPLPIGAFQDQYKQTMINEHNKVKKPNWQEADQLAIYKRSREVELGATENNISQQSERDFNQRPTDFKFGALTIRPRCLQYFYSPLDEMLIHHRVTNSSKLAGTHSYTWIERGTVRVKCLAQEHNTMSPATARTRTTSSTVECRH